MSYYYSTASEVETMTNHNNYQDINQPNPTRKDIYVERQVDTFDVPSENAARDIYEQRVSSPAGEQVVHSEHVSLPSNAARRSSYVSRAKQIIYFVFGV